MNPGLAGRFKTRSERIAEEFADRFAGLHDMPAISAGGILLKTNLKGLAQGCLGRVAVVLLVKPKYLRIALPTPCQSENPCFANNRGNCFLLLKDISMTTGLNGCQPRVLPCVVL
jgi:hypothetical protein